MVVSCLHSGSMIFIAECHLPQSGRQYTCVVGRSYCQSIRRQVSRSANTSLFPRLAPTGSTWTRMRHRSGNWKDGLGFAFWRGHDFPPTKSLSSETGRAYDPARRHSKQCGAGAPMDHQLSYGLPFQDGPVWPPKGPHCKPSNSNAAPTPGARSLFCRRLAQAKIRVDALL